MENYRSCPIRYKPDHDSRVNSTEKNQKSSRRLQDTIECRLFHSITKNHTVKDGARNSTATAHSAQFKRMTQESEMNTHIHVQHKHAQKEVYF